jgi:hypothetical protein
VRTCLARHPGLTEPLATPAWLQAPPQKAAVSAREARLVLLVRRGHGAGVTASGVIQSPGCHELLAAPSATEYGDRRDGLLAQGACSRSASKRPDCRSLAGAGVHARLSRGS